MYRKIFEMVNDEINYLIENSPKNSIELKKIEIKGNKVKLVFLDKVIIKVKTMIYEIDWLEPRLIFKKDYLKPYFDKDYFNYLKNILNNQKK